jgi:transcriptional regulator with PAS, ATPase and Fis domain
MGADGRVIATAGRPWREKSVAAAQALASGRPVPVDAFRQPPEAGEAVRCGGELVGAIACRWIIGSVTFPGAVAAALRAAGLAIATHVRAIAESVSVEPPPSVWGDLLGESPSSSSLREAIQRASRAPFPVLIEGESGSGKELVARAIHKLSPRHTRRFCAINCAALSDELVEAELFGHTRGAFTGAAAERAGLFEEADGGTLFLDEVGELSARAQAKLLRVVQEGEVRRVGENLPRRVDVRIVAATNRRLEQEAAGGRFRTDLRFRLDVLRIVVPPLRERIGDIPILAQHFWRQAATRVGSQASLGPDALAALSRYDWPGNVRELQNAIAWISVHAPRRGRVSAGMLPPRLASSSPLATGSFEAAREEFERRYVRAALAQAGGQRQAAAKALGVSRQGLAKMLRRLRIEQDGVA